LAFNKRCWSKFWKKHNDRFRRYYFYRKSFRIYHFSKKISPF